MRLGRQRAAILLAIGIGITCQSGLGREPAYAQMKPRFRTGAPEGNKTGFMPYGKQGASPLKGQSPHFMPRRNEWGRRVVPNPVQIDSPLGRMRSETGYLSGAGGGHSYFSGEYQSWLQPEAVIQYKEWKEDLEKFEKGQVVPSRTFTESELAENSLSRRVDYYLEQGWVSFKEGRYDQAYNMFTLADRISIKSREREIMVRLSQLYAAVAAEQYGQAISHLGWLLARNPMTGEYRAPLFLLRIDDLPDRYPNRVVYEEDVRNVIELTSLLLDINVTADQIGPGETREAVLQRTQTKIVSPYRALAVVMMWSRNQDEAIFYAQNRLNDKDVPQPWIRLPELVELTRTELARRQSSETDTVTGHHSRIPEGVMPWEVESGALPASANDD